jgi:L,D-peptidoglycan transpeptidase YkuD (ErfK/YbiS/YcfS/YnhG family)
LLTTSHRIARAVVFPLALLAASTAGAADLPVPIPDETRQLVLVTSEGWDSTQGTLRTFERADSGSTWVGAQPAIDVSLGRTGSAWGTGLHAAQAGGPRKVEGDGRSPAGVFDIAQAFGYASTADTGLTYQAMDASDYCIDVAASPLYNQIVDAREVGQAAVEGSTEPMRLDVHGKGDVRYRQGFVIRHNPGNTPRGGSCIFAHLWRTPGEATAGCTAMAEPHMQHLLAWLRQDARPVFVLLPEAEYHRLRASWRLPLIEEKAP